MRTHLVLRTMAAVAALTLGVAACANDARQPAASGDAGRSFVGLRGAAPVALESGQDCDAVLEEFQAFAPTVFEGQRFATFDDVGAALEADTAAGADGAAATSSATPQSRAAGGDTSDTNTQEEGIDEPDLVETDGDFVYLVDQDALVILDGATAAVRSRTPLASHGAQLLLQGDRILAISGGGYGYGLAVDVAVPTADNAVATDGVATDAVEEPVAPPPEPLPEPIAPPSFHAGTVLQLIDVTDRSAPVVLQTTEIEGNHLSTRVVDGVARVVVTTYPQPQPLAEMSFAPGDDVSEVLEAGLADTTIEDWLPSFRSTTGTSTASADAVEGALVQCEDVFMPEVNAGIAETSILRVDFENGFDPSATTTVVAETSTVYASASTLYLAANEYVAPDRIDEVDGDAYSTALHAFDLRGGGAAAHLAAGVVPGHVLNQYSLSEHDGHLRVATTEGAPWDETDPSQSGVRVLRAEGSELLEVGAVTGLGVTETIQSVRFMGPVGYVVTFRQTDPLYVIDLADPTDPKAVGELKIPGFSSYLHPVSGDRLVGIGRDADLEGRELGLLVSLFDVSDPTNPQQVQTYSEREAWSAAGHDPKAFLWWEPESAVVIPIERYGAGSGATAESGADRIAGYQMGITVLDISDDGISQRATVVAPDGRYPVRSLVVQGRLWSLFDGGVVVSDFANPAEGVFTGFR